MMGVKDRVWGVGSGGNIIFELHLEMVIKSACQRNACICSPKAMCAETHSSTFMEAPKLSPSDAHIEVNTPRLLAATWMNHSNVTLDQGSQAKTTPG